MLAKAKRPRAACGSIAAPLEPKQDMDGLSPNVVYPDKDTNSTRFERPVRGRESGYWVWVDVVGGASFVRA